MHKYNLDGVRTEIVRYLASILKACSDTILIMMIIRSQKKLTFKVFNICFI